MKASGFGSLLVTLGLSSLAEATIQQTTMAGGLDHGTLFSDLAIVKANEPAAILATVTIRGGSRIDGLTNVYAWNAIPAISHGGTGGTARTISLDYGENIISVEACADRYRPNVFTAYHTRIFSLSVTTTAGKSLSVGSRSGTCVTWAAPSGMGLVGWEGRDGTEIDAIAPIWGTPSDFT